VLAAGKRPEALIVSPQTTIVSSSASANRGPHDS
jgi:hypothetical protein